MSTEYMNVMNNIKTPIKKEYKAKIETKKIYTPIPYSKKDQIKELGGVWDSNKKLWYIKPDNINKKEIIDTSKKYYDWIIKNERPFNPYDFTYKEV